MTPEISAFFKKRWKSLFIITLPLLLFTLYYAVFWRMFAPIPSTNIWLDGDDIVVFYGDVFTTPLTQSRGLFFFDVREKKLVRWESVMTNPNGYALIAWISQKQQLLFNGSIDSVYGLYFLDTEGNTTRKIETIDLHSSGNHAISSDGKYIAFVHEGDIYIQNIEEFGQKKLTDDDYINGEPDWSPNNQELIFRTYRQDEDVSAIVRINKDGTDPRTLTQNPNQLYDPQWSPDGNMIAFKESNQRFRDSLWIMNSDGSNARQILTPDEDGDTIHDFAWSPDSKHIVFVSSRDGFYGIIKVEYQPTWTRSLYLIDVNTGEVTRLTNKWLFYTDLAWVD